MALRDAEKIPRDPAWTSNPAFYPVYAETYEPPTEESPGTGVLLRALLPYATVESRQTLSSYAGNVLVLNARATCQASAVATLTTNSTYGLINGTVASTNDDVHYDVSCLRGGTTICQLGQGAEAPSTLLKSAFENLTAPGAVFLVTSEGTTSEDTRE